LTKWGSDHPRFVRTACHPSLPFDAAKFRRFSSQVSGGWEAEYYIKKVAGIAKRHFNKSIYYWSEYGDFPNMRYTWTEVHMARGYTEEAESSTIPFRVVAMAVLTGFERMHEGMDGLWIKEAEFPDNEGYRIVHENRGFKRVDRMEDWTEYVQGYEEARAYWATHANNNCAALNGALFMVLKYLEDHGISNISLPVTTGNTYKVELVKISSLSSRKIGLTPHHVGTIVAPPVVSRVPPSPGWRNVL
jgi:hypothetical protein